MKKLILLTVLAVALLASIAVAGQNRIFDINIFNNTTTISASGNATHTLDPDLDYYKPTGNFSLAVDITGDGTAKIEYLCLINAVYVEPQGADDIVTAHTKTSGSSGKNIYSFSPPICKNMQIKITETGGANSLTITEVRVVIQ